MKDAVDRTTKVTLRSTMATEDGRVHSFVARGVVPVFDGWRRLARPEVPEEEGKEERAILPDLEEGRRLSAMDGRLVHKKTKPPRRYTEAALVKALERRGIGRPSTYAAIMETLHTREYVVVDGRHLVPTELAFSVIEALEGRFDFAEYDYTREIEASLDRIAQGRHRYIDLVADVDRKLDEELSRLSGLEIGDAPRYACPECGSVLRKRKGSNGPFWGCSGYPDCRFTAPDEGGEPQILSEEEKNAHPCPECHDGHLRRRKGRNGYFWGCDRYPECKCTRPDDRGSPGERKPRSENRNYRAGASCPKCRQGKLVERTLKKGANEGKAFLGCTGYPDCDFFAWAQPRNGGPDG